MTDTCNATTVCGCAENVPLGVGGGWLEVSKGVVLCDGYLHGYG